MNVISLHDPDEWRRRKATELNLSTREVEMVQRLEMIATGTAGGDAETDLELARDIALEALEIIGWPTARPRKAAS